MKKSDWYKKVILDSVLSDGCFLFTGYKNFGGYGRVSINGKKEMVHKMSYKKFKGEIPKGMIIRHTCDNRACWNPDHLILGSKADNSKDMVDRGRSAKGSKNANSKLVESDIISIKKLLESGVTHSEIAKEFSIHESSVSYIKLNRTWKHV